MDEQKHTPGPWKIETDSEWPEDYGGVFGGQVTWPTAIQPVLTYAEFAKEHAMGNARLMAAAPELLEACKAMIEAFSPDIYRMSAAQFGKADLAHEAYRKAIVAIVKATG